MVKRIVPVLRLASLEHEVHRVLSRALFRSPSRLALEKGFVPAIDVLEKKREVVVELELPGVQPEDVTLVVYHNRLEVKGMKKEEAIPGGGTFLRLEREYGTFRRVVDLPSSILPERTQAVLRDGVLVITLKRP